LEANASRKVNCSSRDTIAEFLVEFAGTITIEFGEDEAARRFCLAQLQNSAWARRDADLIASGVFAAA